MSDARSPAAVPDVTALALEKLRDPVPCACSRTPSVGLSADEAAALLAELERVGQERDEWEAHARGWRPVDDFMQRAERAERERDEAWGLASAATNREHEAEARERELADAALHYLDDPHEESGRTLEALVNRAVAGRPPADREEKHD